MNTNAFGALLVVYKCVAIGAPIVGVLWMIKTWLPRSLAARMAWLFVLTALVFAPLEFDTWRSNFWKPWMSWLFVAMAANIVLQWSSGTLQALLFAVMALCGVISVISWRRSRNAGRAKP